MPFLSTLEEMALERGQQIGAKETRKKDIINLLKKRFGNLTDELIQSLNKIDDLSFLDTLILETISVNYVAEFQELINQNSPN